jgi:hypothetical protein
MGVYHLMGLGFSPGVITGPLSYLGQRYQRWDKEDQAFFAGSGEVAHHEEGSKVGYVQALVIFTTKEVLCGEKQAFGYIDNRAGQINGTNCDRKEQMKPLLFKKLLPRIWPDIAGGHSEAQIFWCEVDRMDIKNCYERIIRVVAALGGVGGQGKEMWANVTGGSNVVNLALQLAATLSGNVARLYYIQADSQASNDTQAKAATQCIRHTTEEGYWVDLPVMPLAISRLQQAALALLGKHSNLNLQDLYSRLCQERSNLIQGISKDRFKEEYLTPMWKPQLIAGGDDGYYIGPQWPRIRAYQDVLEEARLAEHSSIGQLAEAEPWLEEETISF